MSKGNLCPVLRGDRQEAGSLLEASTLFCPRPFISSLLMKSLSRDSELSLPVGQEKNYECILNENDKAIKTGCELGDRLKSINIAGLI